MRTSIFTALLVTLLGTAAGCSKKAPTSEPTPPAAAAEGAGAEATPSEPASAGRRMFIECKPEQRGVQACTMDYSPVCGQHADNQPAKTYSNVCGACTDSNVTGYFTGECETGENE